MAIEYVKRASETPETETDTARAVVSEMLAAIEEGGEQAVRRYAKTLDRWDGEILVMAAEAERRTGDLPPGLKRDIDFAADRVRRFAQAQRDSIRDFTVELSPGVTPGQRLVPVNVAGCYVPIGHYARVASAYMSIATAKAAGVKTVVACSAPCRGEGIHPSVLYAMKAAGADIILTLGGVQAVATWRTACSPGSPPTSSSGLTTIRRGGQVLPVRQSRHRRLRRSVRSGRNCR